MQQDQTAEQATDAVQAAPEVQQEAPADAPPKDAEQAQPTEQQDGEGDKPRDDKGRFRSVQGRIDELTRARYEAEREGAYWRGVAQGGPQGSQAQPSAAQAAAAPKPTPEHFTDYAEYVEALTGWKAEQMVQAALTQRDQAAAQRVERDLLQERASTWAQRQEAARKSIPDYDDVMGSVQDARIAQHVGESILDTENGPAIAYHFAKNPSDLARINSLPPMAAAREIGRLSAVLAAPQTAAAPSAKQVSSAPAPIKPIGAGASTNTDPATMSMDQYIAMRQKQGARWAR